MDQLTFTLLLDYIYNRFAVTLVLCSIGVFIKNIINDISYKRKVSIGKTVASSMFSTVLMCAVKDYIDIAFSVYVLTCVIVGMWSTKIISLVADSKFMGKVTKRLLKSIANPVADAVSDVLDEEENKNNDGIDNKPTTVDDNDNLSKKYKEEG